MAENPLVRQPGFSPDVMSLRPMRPRLYVQGFRKPSGGLPSESRWSLREIIPATICTLAVSWMDDAERWEVGETHWRRAACSVQDNDFTVEENPDPHRLRGDIWDVAAPRTAQELQRENRSDQVTEANVLVEAVILIAEALEEGGYGLLLVARVQKVVREAAPASLQSLACSPSLRQR